MVSLTRDVDHPAYSLSVEQMRRVKRRLTNLHFCWAHRRLVSLFHPKDRLGGVTDCDGTTKAPQRKRS
ncbi:unnamed protein product [Protopolystoma xenopodis]|uniref:Uncharacterized protein n=1 Tax=Protopolystoma xenopodis TaxID=117903 RepID=A0A3S5BNT0_9PLAT|nr:unnamed protein product [Protopolystoma xenopodis]